jgi:hypothetical protein
VNLFFILEFRRREITDMCLLLDGTKYLNSGKPLKIMKVKKFIDHWNRKVEETQK